MNFLGQNLYPVHAACIGLDKFVLLVGHSGVGKTTVLLRLVNDLGCKIFSGNKTIISISEPAGFTAVAATTAISLREQDLSRYPKLQDKITKFSDRAALFLDSSQYCDQPSVKIDSIFIIKLSENYNETTVLNYPSSLHLLYPYFLDTVSADTVLCNGTDVYSGVVSRRIQVSLARSLNHFINRVNIIKISGSADYLISEIGKHI